MKKITTIMSAFLICLLTISSAPMLFGNSSLTFGNFASASTGAANFLPNYWYNGTGTVDTQNEINLSRTTAQYITSQLATKYPSSYFAAYDTNCDLATYRSVTSYLKNNYDYAVIYSKGHRSESGAHISLADHYGANFYDHDIATRTSYNQNRFTFIWHCRTAEKYNNNGQPNTDALGAIGMPYAYTHNNYLLEYGTSGHQVYLGWKDKTPLTVYNSTLNPPQYHNVTLMGGNKVGSPQYEWEINPYYNYAEVARTFWFSVRCGVTTKQALDELSYAIYGRSFATSGNSFNDLYGWLMVYGNWNLGLPPHSSPRYVSSIASGSPTNIGSGYVSNAYGITGSAPDGNIAYISGINTGAGGHIVGVMNGVAKGEIRVNATSVHGYNTRLQVFVSNDNANWVSMGSKTVTGGTGWQWVNFGTYNSNFQYIGIAAMNQNGYEPANIYIDAVEVRP